MCRGRKGLGRCHLLSKIPGKPGNVWKRTHAAGEATFNFKDLPCGTERDIRIKTFLISKMIIFILYSFHSVFFLSYFKIFLIREV